MARILTQIDAARPWLAFIRPLLQRLNLDGWEGPEGQIWSALNAQAQARNLVNSRGAALSFVAQSALPDGCAYESFIDTQAQVPSRDNLHDLLNALIWISFPRIKQQLNALQAAQIALMGVGQARGAVRDALTLFDENAAIVVLRKGDTGQAIAQALKQHDWDTLFVQQRAAFGHQIEVVLFGHALLEKLCVPYKAITAHAWLLWADEWFFTMEQDRQRTWIDAQMALELIQKSAQQSAQQSVQQSAEQGAEQGTLSTACFTPLPVLGVPGWWPQQDALFYADKSVFRVRSLRGGLK